LPLEDNLAFVGKCAFAVLRQLASPCAHDIDQAYSSRSHLPPPVDFVMGKRKKSSRKPQGPRKNEPLPTVFTCLFCNHENSVTVKLEKKSGVGALECKICGQKFQCGINYLSAAVDVYSEWVDAADAVAQDGGAEPSRGDDLVTRRRLNSGREGGSQRRVDLDDEEGYAGEGIVADDNDYE